VKDSHSDVKIAQAVVPAVKTAAGDGTTVDIRGYSSLLFVANTGAIASDGDFGLVVQDSANGTDWSAVSADKLLGAFPATLEANKTYAVGYVGGKRYARVNVTKAGGTSIAAGVVAILGDPAVAPVA